MRNLLLFLLTLLSTAPLHAADDQVQQTIAACGKPLRDYLGPTDSSAPVAERILKYREHSVFFDRQSGTPIFTRLSNGTRAFRTVDEARTEMPCLGKTSFAALVAAAPLTERTTTRNSSGAFAALGLLFPVLACLGFAFYLLPTIVSVARKTARNAGIVTLNVLLGWTFIGWVIALVWACTAETQSAAALREMAYRNMAAQPPPPPR